MQFSSPRHLRAAFLAALYNIPKVTSFSMMNMSISTSGKTSSPLVNLSDSFDHTWVSQLKSETEENRIKSQQRSPQDDGVSNNVKRPVYNGHYVLVKPRPLENPRLVIHSPDVARKLNLSKEDVSSQSFLQFFSGDVEKAFQTMNIDDKERIIKTWATPYALSIMGKRYTSNCPYGTGDGYGDGRAISIGEVKVDLNSSQDDNNHHESFRYELQLKGAGPTPFCRGADGRAVLRSSIREFLASEAMHQLGISTTRALSLIVSEGSDGDKSQRPWYSNNNKQVLPSLNDPRLSAYSIEKRKQIIAQLSAQMKNDPDIMIEEPCAITCRVAPSFLRVGHLDLFARRATKDVVDMNTAPNKDTDEFKELEDLVWHACFREFPTTCYHPYRESNDILSASKCLLEKSLDGISTMVANWLRVGFVQGNFNADNCLVAGRTMDYGPFGFMDEYNPLFAKWTGSGDHFGFMNQPNAGYINHAMLVVSIMPIIEAYSPSMDDANSFKNYMMEKSKSVFEEKVNSTFRIKLGFHPEDDTHDEELWPELETLMRDNRVDWTVFWRQLTYVAKEYPIMETKSTNIPSSKDYVAMLELLIANDEVKEGSSPFYSTLEENSRKSLLNWIQKWREALIMSYSSNGKSYQLSIKNDGEIISPEERMRTSNPKYVLREWMLVEAYSKASPNTLSSSSSSPLSFLIVNAPAADDSLVHELFDLIQNPYDEGTDDQDQKYYRRAPDEALSAGGTAFMS